MAAAVDRSAFVSGKFKVTVHGIAQDFSHVLRVEAAVGATNVELG